MSYLKIVVLVVLAAASVGIPYSFYFEQCFFDAARGRANFWGEPSRPYDPKTVGDDTTAEGRKARLEAEKEFAAWEKEDKALTEKWGGPWAKRRDLRYAMVKPAQLTAAVTCGVAALTALIVLSRREGAALAGLSWKQVGLIGLLPFLVAFAEVLMGQIDVFGRLYWWGAGYLVDGAGKHDSTAFLVGVCIAAPPAIAWLLSALIVRGCSPDFSAGLPSTNDV